MGKNVDGLVDGIAQTSPDILGLQEIVEDHPNTNNLNSAYLLQKQLREKSIEYEAAYFPAFKSDRHVTHHEIGNAILSKFPISKAEAHFLSDLEMYHNRGLTPARDAEPTEFTKIQTRELLRIIGTGKDTILLGDFNVIPECETIKEISRVLRNTDPEQQPTWPTVAEAGRCHQERYGVSEAEPKLLTHRLDQIFVGPGIEAVDFSLGESLASDHKSLVTILEI